ncbi:MULTISPECIES: lipopolysaccharide assembly protein LapB [unclassified Oceanispirochaeta]|uniref:tetratricopeptide repeat protein n=1 Tax=unclassified Oceanispirochaeta TaxID=2635722 RepID=UPI000E09ACCB|nr:MULTISPECIES: tetratricopeptide repeat protein [unclassified Oceanispirochaeta]MBF9016431.1 tetratricopeptide repeat protein [Oceanispirochaeta sp. M2]NPD72893.1 tetratricopeptide repeat protein [Oceanispirochaeta sp. M1]RDG31470.1 tetratricopeptide repeat protein [Oceanispirochaeta sp. M1]
MKRILICIIFLFILTLTLLQSEENLLTIDAVPYGTLPMGSSSDIFKLGYGIDLEISYKPAAWRNFGIGINGDYLIIPLESQDSIWVASGLGGAVFQMSLGDKFSIFARAGAGYYFFNALGWDTGGNNGGGLRFGGAGGGAFNIAGPFSMGLGLSYDYYSDLYNGLGISINARFDFVSETGKRAVRDYSADDNKKIDPMKEGKGKGVELRDMELITLFPVLYKYYDDNPIGTVRVINFESKKAEDIIVQFYMERYMDNPMESIELFTLGPGEEKTIELYGLFTEDMMNITEGTKASARVSVSYTMADKEKSKNYNPVLELNNRNALTWDDDRKIASFITAKDPEILSFSKKVTNWMQEFENPSIDENLQKGMVLFEAVKSYGVRYEVDPATPFAALSEQTSTVDFIQFPRQTLGYTTGDCDDLTALYSSLLEAVGVETGIITIPGHIYMAFSLKASPDDVRSKYSRIDEFIFLEDKVWVPIEITMFQESFEGAWQNGAKEWRENDSKSQAMFYPTHESWSYYQAVGFREEAVGGIEMPSRNDVTTEFVKTISRFVDQEIYPQEAKIRERMASSNKKYIYQNKMAVLYARYGLYDKALSTFAEINESRNYIPSLLNTGNIYFVQNDYMSALKWYDQVLARDSQNKKALLGSARCNHELENYGTVKLYYQKLSKIDTDLAERFAYLDLRGAEGQRAADALGLKDLVLWEEEE